MTVLIQKFAIDHDSSKKLSSDIRRVSGEVNLTAFLLQQLSIAVQRGIHAASVLGTIVSTEVFGEFV